MKIDKNFKKEDLKEMIKTQVTFDFRRKLSINRHTF